jgi:hypothetical protein
MLDKAQLTWNGQIARKPQTTYQEEIENLNVFMISRANDFIIQHFSQRNTQDQKTSWGLKLLRLTSILHEHSKNRREWNTFHLVLQSQYYPETKNTMIHHRKVKIDNNIRGVFDPIISKMNATAWKKKVIYHDQLEFIPEV